MEKFVRINKVLIAQKQCFRAIRSLSPCTTCIVSLYSENVINYWYFFYIIEIMKYMKFVICNIYEICSLLIKLRISIC